MTTPESMIIALVRHGETEWNRQRRWQGREGVGLNELGRRQASAAVPLLRGVGWSWMITSPLERTRQTARIIADELAELAAASPLPLDEDEGVIERAYGAAEGVLAAEAARRWPDGRFPGMETDTELADRGAAALRRIAAERSDSGIVISHGSFIRATINALCGADAAPRILNGSVSLLRTDGRTWDLIDVNRVTDVAEAGLIEHSGG